MKHLSRRQLVSVAGSFAFLYSATNGIAQESSKPEVKVSQARPIVTEYVEKLSAASKANGGDEFSAQRKAEIVDSILATMKDQHVYNFVDP
jgi:hypothetical protein